MKPESRQWEILLVEDNPADVRLTEEAFKGMQLNHRLQVARDGLAAMNYLNNLDTDVSGVRPDIIILDLNLPCMSGLEVLAAIKSDEATKSIPVIVMSSSNAASDVSEAYRLNANCYAQKPHTVDDFFAAMENLSRFWIGTAVLPDFPVPMTH